LTAFSLSPRVHLLEIECQRPNARVALHGGIDFEMTVEPDTTYLLDCAPEGDYDNHFSLARVDAEEGNQPPLDVSRWLGCYQVTINKVDALVDLGIVRFTGYLAPPIASTYVVEWLTPGVRPMQMEWWPVSPVSIHLGLGDDPTGWSGVLEQTPTGLQGPAERRDDTGRMERDWTIRASRSSCDSHPARWRLNSAVNR
jgi:hypothetical protein